MVKRRYWRVLQDSKEMTTHYGCLYVEGPRETQGTKYTLRLFCINLMTIFS